MSDQPAPPPRVVYDCNIYVQAIINVRGPAARCVEKVRAAEVTLFVTPFILDEIRESYLKIPRKYGVTPEQTETMAIAVAGVATIITNVPTVFEYDRDPDDAHYVNLAIAADARLIVSRDKDLLDLMDPTREPGKAFQSRFPSIRIIDPVALLRELDQSRSQTDRG